VYSERRVKHSELLQLVLLNVLYSQKGSEKLFFQGGTAIRWVYGGLRFSEDLDFVTSHEREGIESLLKKTASATANTCVAHFGPGAAELQKKAARETAFKAFYVYRPEKQREKIAVKLDFEILKPDRQPETLRYILRDIPQVAGLMKDGHLLLPYASSVILAETPEEILSDKIRAMFERNYIKGRDIYDIWWLVSRMNVKPNWAMTRKKLSMYRMRFSLTRSAGYFLTHKAEKEIQIAIESDLPRFLPPAIYREYHKDNFRQFFETLGQVTALLTKQGMCDDALAIQADL
jgi:predicted nucleotidyltransferase component of viral defense system